MVDPSSIAEGARVGAHVLGRYRVLRVLGSGGMGEVYEAEHSSVGKRVALKCLWPKLAAEPEFVQRFEREGRVASMVKSPHVVDVLDAGTLEDGVPFLVMELLEGTPLSRELEHGPLSGAAAVDVAKQIAAGLDAAHAAGIVHRDLKPDNVFIVDPMGKRHVKIVDFGVSKFQRALPHETARDGITPSVELTRAGSMIGTPSYMSPEQAEGLADVDARADVWSLGVILFRMLSGELPFVGENFARLLMKVVSDERAPRVRSLRPDVSPELDALVARCLEKPRDARFQSMAELALALEQLPAPVPRANVVAMDPSPEATIIAPVARTSEVGLRSPPEPDWVPAGGTMISAPQARAHSTVPPRERPTVAPPAAERAAETMPPPRAAPRTPAPLALPFDEVLLREPEGPRRLPALAFFELPLSERIRHVIARTVVFLASGIEVDRQDALARMREQRAS